MLVIPSLCVPARTPAPRALELGPGATLELPKGHRYTRLELAMCGLGTRGSGTLPRGGQCPRRDRTCPIEDRREHDIDVEPRLTRQQSRPAAATTGPSCRPPAHPALFWRDGAVIRFPGCLECNRDVAPTATESSAGCRVLGVR